MRSRLIIIGAIALTVVGVLTYFLITKLSKLSQDNAQSNWPTHGWRTCTPEEQGFDSLKLSEGLQNLKEKKILIDSLQIIRNGCVVLDAYFYPYDNTIPHNLASVTKSFTTTLIGIAIDQGKVGLDQTMVSFFPDRTIANLDEWKQKITIRQLVSNLNGLESGCLNGDEIGLDAMRSTPDWVQAALDRKAVWEPGINFCYDSPGMHLLSAIIQQATGMTELEFAQKNLFTPLGIKDVFWKADPQGYTHGWGDLYLKPLDAAKLGYLWLNQGVWDGKQIVSSSWVTDSVKAYSTTSEDGYGYGWWISDDGYNAVGRGGQYVRVYPAHNAIVVTTATALDYDQVGSMIDAAFVDPEKPLPANPSGVAELSSTLTSIASSTHPWQTGPLPDMAKTISGKTYGFEPNILEVASMRFQFKDNKEATLYLNVEGRDSVWPIGLDGKYRLEPDGRALRGYWFDANTFVLEIFEVGLRTYKIYFEDDRMIIDTSVMQIEGKLENP